MNNLHIFLTDFKNASRGIKQATSLHKSNIMKEIHVAALYSEGVLEDEVYDGFINIKRFKLKTRGWSKIFISQFLKYLEFCWLTYQCYKEKNIDVVNVHTLSLLPLGAFLRWKFNAKLIYDAHELETEKNGLWGFRKKVAKIIERVFIRKVDLTIVVSENIADWYRDTYKITRPPVVMNVPFKQSPIKNDLFREGLGIRKDQVIFLYQGGLFKGRGIELILNAFKERQKDDAVIVFMGYGQLENEIRKSSFECNNIYYFPAVEPSRVLEYTVAADVGLSIIENTCLSYNYCMPNKLFEYSMAGLAVVVSNMKEMAEFVTNNNSGFVFEGSSSQDLNTMIDSLLSKDLNQIKNNARKAALNNSWEYQEKKMLHAYKELLNEK
jgi:glycosyltransferase involved in cell wall biosynthesis